MRFLSHISTINPYNNKEYCVLSTLTKTGLNYNVSILYFPYDCSHETPFPILDGEKSELVESCFNRAFANSVKFLL